MWDWVVKGDFWMRFKYEGAIGSSATATDARIVVGAYVYPKYAWSDDDGATWTWIEPGDASSASRIADVGDTLDGKTVFLDNNSAMEQLIYGDGSWTSGAFGHDEPSDAYAYRMAGYYLAYKGGTTAHTEVLATNIWTAYRGYQQAPKVADSPDAVSFKIYVADSGGNTRRVMSCKRAGTVANPAIERETISRAPDGNAWTPARFNEVHSRVGFDRTLNKDISSARINKYETGGALKALTWELLVPAPAGTPASPCQQLLDLSMARMASGEGTGVATGQPPNVDLSDVKFTSGEGDGTPGGSGIDITDVLFSSGGEPE